MKHTERKIWLAALAMLAAALPMGCNRGPTVTEPTPLDVIVAHPTKGTIDDRDIYTGTLKPKNEVEIRSRVSGYIKDVRFTEGDEIEAGTVLFLIDSDPFEAQLKQAQGQLAGWEAKLKGAEDKITIYKPLADKGTVSKDEVNQAFASKDEALGGIDATKGKIAEIKLNIEYCKVKSLIAGKVGAAEITKGNLVGATGSESLLTRVVEVDPMYVEFNVNERALQRYLRILSNKAAKEGTKEKPKIPVELALSDETDFPYVGIIDFVDNRVDVKTSSIKVRARFENKPVNGFRPLTAGYFARVRVNIGGKQEGILLPDRAILSDQSLKYVLVVEKGSKNMVRRKDIEVSERRQENGMRAVLKGLTGDEWVIIDGVNRVRDGAVVTPKEEEVKTAQASAPGK